MFTLKKKENNNVNILLFFREFEYDKKEGKLFAWGLEFIACETFEKQVDRQKDRQTETDRQLLIRSPKVLTISISF